MFNLYHVIYRDSNCVEIFIVEFQWLFSARKRLTNFLKKYNVSTKYSDSDFIHNSLYALYKPITVHDCKFFFCVLLAIVLRRLQIVRAYETKVFATKGKLVKSQDKFEALSDKANLDVSSLHKVYDSLHICSEVLNSVMSFPVKF